MDNKGKRILIIEDEKNIAQILAFNIMKDGYEYDIAYDGEDGLNRALTGIYDLILLDIMLPKLNGYEVCAKIRRKLATPIIMVTAREEEKDKVLGLDTGADDYVTKPFAINELLSRIKANIRRSANEILRDVPAAERNILKIRELEIDCDRYHVAINGAEIEMSKKEYDLLLHLAKNLGKPFSREELLEVVWGYEVFYGDVRTVDVTISRLREKLGEDPGKPKYLFTKRGIGYFLK